MCVETVTAHVTHLSRLARGGAGLNRGGTRTSLGASLATTRRGDAPMLDRPARLQDYQTYIDGKWSEAASGKKFETHDPYTGEPWALARA